MYYTLACIQKTYRSSKAITQNSWMFSSIFSQTGKEENTYPPGQLFAGKNKYICRRVINVNNMKNEFLQSLPKERLIQLIEDYSKNWLAMDGVWFQSIEQKLGMDEAMFHDAEAWRKFTVIEAKRIKQFLELPERPGLKGLALALQLRFYANLNEADILMDEEEKVLVYRTRECRVQRARERKHMPFHPCKPVGEIEYAGFARTIDDRIGCECLSCYPDVTDPTCCCAWRFRLKE